MIEHISIKESLSKREKMNRERWKYILDVYSEDEGFVNLSVKPPEKLVYNLCSVTFLCHFALFFHIRVFIIVVLRSKVNQHCIVFCSHRRKPDFYDLCTCIDMVCVHFLADTGFSLACHLASWLSRISGRDLSKSWRVPLRRQLDCSRKKLRGWFLSQHQSACHRLLPGGTAGCGCRPPGSTLQMADFQHLPNSLDNWLLFTAFWQ